jgi:hypothetical protein
MNYQTLPAMGRNSKSASMITSFFRGVVGGLGMKDFLKYILPEALNHLCVQPLSPPNISAQG